MGTKNSGVLVSMKPWLYACLSTCRLYNKMTMEVILSTAFGRTVNVQGGKGGKLLESAMTLFAAYTPPKEGDPESFFKKLQFLLCRLNSTELSDHLLIFNIALGTSYVGR